MLRSSFISTACITAALLFVALYRPDAFAHRDPEISRKLYQQVLDKMQIALPTNASRPGEPRQVFKADGKMQHWIVRATRWVFHRTDCPSSEVCVILDSDPVHHLLLDVLTDMEDTLAHAEHHCGGNCSHVHQDAPVIRSVLSQAKKDISKAIFISQATQGKVTPAPPQPKPKSGILTAAGHLASDLISLPPRISGFLAYGGVFGAAAWGLTELGEQITSVHLFCTVNITLASMLPNVIHRAVRNLKVHQKAQIIATTLGQGSPQESWIQKRKRIGLKVWTLFYVRALQPLGAIYTYTRDKKRIQRLSRSGTIGSSDTDDGKQVRRFDLPQRIPAAGTIRNHGLSVGSVISELWRKLSPIWESKESKPKRTPGDGEFLRSLEIVNGDVLWPDVMIFDQGIQPADLPAPTHSFIDEIIEIGNDPDALSRVWRTERLTAVLMMMSFWLGDENEGFFEGIWSTSFNEAVAGYVETFPKEWATNEVRKSLQHFRHILLALAYQEGPQAAELRRATQTHFVNQVLPMLRIAGGDRASLTQNGQEFGTLSQVARQERRVLRLALKALECGRIAEGSRG